MYVPLQPCHIASATHFWPLKPCMYIIHKCFKQRISADPASFFVRFTAPLLSFGKLYPERARTLRKHLNLRPFTRLSRLRRQQIMKYMRLKNRCNHVAAVFFWQLQRFRFAFVVCLHNYLAILYVELFAGNKYIYAHTHSLSSKDNKLAAFTEKRKRTTIAGTEKMVCLPQNSRCNQHPLA